MRTAVIGCGAVSTVHLAALATLDDVELVAVCDPDPSKGGDFTDHHVLLAEARPDVVHLCTPHDTHVPIALDCLEAGVHVLTEKPVAATVAEAERLVTAAGEHPELKVGVCLQNRYNLAAQAAWKLLGSGELGAVVGGSATLMWHRDTAYYERSPWRGQKKRSGGGVLINQAIHTLDLLQWLLGEVTAVRGHAGRFGTIRGIDVEDTVNAFLEHEGGATSVLFATNTNVVDAPVTIDVVAERGSLRISGDLTVSYADGRVEVIAERVAGPDGRAYWGASHELLIADFYRTLADPEPFWISPAEGTRSLRLVEQTYRGTDERPI